MRRATVRRSGLPCVTVHSIIGAGNLGAALAGAWSARRHIVNIAVRDPDVTDPVTGGTPAGVTVSSVEHVLRDAEAVVLTLPSRVLNDALPPLAAALAGRVVVDATNPVGPGLQLMVRADGISQAERVQQMLPGAHVVTCFNQTGANNIPAPVMTPRPVMFVAGDDEQACEVVATLASDIGFESVQAGKLSRSRDLEHLAMLWIALSALPQSALGRQCTFAAHRS